MEKYDSILDAVKSIKGESVSIESEERIRGGDVNEAWKLHLSDGTELFMKTNGNRNADFFKAEGDGIKAIADTNTIAVPKIYGYGTDEERNLSFLIMEVIAKAEKGENFWSNFAESLAAMHKSPTEQFVTGGKYGLFEDNYIGAGKQINTPKDTWVEFFAECRLKVMYERVKDVLADADRNRIEYILSEPEKYLVEPLRPSLVHGDLWSGNFIVGADGRAWLMDPAVYVGNAEVDIAMTELFGGFRFEFYQEYHKVGLIMPGYEDRRDIDNLYHMLNHVNLFGRAYLGSVHTLLHKYD